MRKVVSLDGQEHPLDLVQQKLLKKAGAEWFNSHCVTEEETIEAARDADGVLFSDAPLTERVLKSLPKCKFAIRYGIGMNNIDVNAATRLGMVVANVPDAFTDEVANHGLAMLLALGRSLFPYDRAMHSGDWNLPETKALWNGSVIGAHPLHGETVGIVGFGRIGQSLAKKCLSMRMEVLAYDPLISKDLISKKKCKPSALKKMIQQADYLVLSCPLTDSTRKLIGETELKQMKRTAYLINIARGDIVDEAALEKALRENWIAGAGLDVFSVEPITNSNPFRPLNNVILTPHAGSYSPVAYQKLRDTVVEQAVQILKGQWPTYLYNEEIKGHLRINKLWKE